MAERLFTIPLTSDLDGLQHEVTDENFTSNNTGFYTAVCGALVRAVSATAPPGPPHGQCLDIVATSRRAAAAPEPVTVPSQSRGRHRRRVLALLHGGRR